MTHPQIVSEQPKRIARVGAVHDMSVLFPEVPALVNHRHVKQMGFQDSAAGGVPTRIPGFIQEEDFMMEFVSFMANPRRFMFTLFGPTGCGKSERVLDVYARLNIPVYRCVATANTKLYDIFCDLRIKEDGKTEILPKALYKAMKNGYPFLIDEVYRLNPGITAKFHEIRDRGQIYVDETGETLIAKPGFKFIATANHGGLGDDTGQYVGDQVQDMAWLNGSYAFQCDYPQEHIEVARVQKILEDGIAVFKTDPKLSTYAIKMVEVASACRAAMKGDAGVGTPRFELPFSTRNLEMWAEAFLDFHQSHPNRSGSVHPLYRSLDSVMARRACEATRKSIDGFILAKFSIPRQIP